MKYIERAFYTVLAGLMCGVLISECKAETRTMINLASYHFQRPDFETGMEEYNEKNMGVGIEWQPRDSSNYIGTGFYDNSYFSKSRYITVGRRVSEHEESFLAIELIAADGYELSPYSHDGLIIIPAAVLGAKITERHNLKLIVMRGIMGLQYGLSWGN